MNYGRCAEVGAIAGERSSLQWSLGPLRPFLDDADITELCLNRPGALFLETASGWRQVPLPEATFDWCLRFAKLVAHDTRQRIDETAPLLSASLPSGERVQIVIPPATPQGQVAITIRRSSREHWSLDDLAGRGLFRRTRAQGCARQETEQTLRALLARRDYLQFLRLAVRSRLNIVVSGPTGSGKTTCTKALIREIPSEERLITIEDAQELELERHSNHVRLFYSKDAQGLSRVTPRRLLEACLRMRPDRILLAELRAEEAFDYLRNVNSGHPGSITSVHATSAALAFEQLTLLVKQSSAGAALSREDIKQLLYGLVDVVVQFEVHEHQRGVQEIWYEPRQLPA